MARLNRKRGRKSNYVKSLNNSTHRAARERCMIRDRFKCRFPGCDSKIYLEYHHIDYAVSGRELVGENLRWTVILCETHHELVHKTPTHIWNPKNSFKKPI